MVISHEENISENSVHTVFTINHQLWFVNIFNHSKSHLQTVSWPFAYKMFQLLQNVTIFYDALIRIIFKILVCGDPGCTGIQSPSPKSGPDTSARLLQFLGHRVYHWLR